MPAILSTAGIFLSGGSVVLRAADGAVDAHAIPVINGDIGPCSSEFTVKDRAGAPVYAAKIRVHIAYGFASAHKLDLEVGTNVDGKARFEGLPNRVKRPLRYEASQDEREGSAVYDPADNCKSEQVIVITKPESSASPQ
jgi:hypothetical protein